MPTVAEVFTLAWKHHQAGGFTQAEHLYRQVLQADPMHSDAWCFLGAACQAQGKIGEAEMSFRRAVQVFPEHASAHNCLGVLLAQRGQLTESVASFRAANRAQPDNPEIRNNLGLALARHGQLVEAIEHYRQVLRMKPDYAVAHYNLGLALNAQQQRESAIEAFTNALRLQPEYPDAWCDLGNAQAELGKLEEAQGSYLKAIRLRPQYAEAYYNLAVVLGKQNKMDDAIAQYRNAVRCRPDYAEAHLGLGHALRQKGQMDGAMSCYRQAVKCRPDSADAHFNLGWMLDDQGKPADAEIHYQQAVQLKPEWPEAHHNLGLARKKQGKLAQSVAEFQEALRLKPEFPEALYTLGNTLQELGRMEDAVEAFRQAIRVKPDYALAHNNLGGAFLQQGLPELALVSFRKAIELQPDLAEAQSNLLFCLNYDPDADPDAVFAEYRRWGEQMEGRRDAMCEMRSAECEVQEEEVQRAGTFTPSTPHSALRTPHERPLRVGYVSPDLRQHALTRYFEPVLAHHDPEVVEAICYAEVARPDPCTLRLQKLAHGWRSTCRLTDAQIAQQIRDDRIDILVDLAGHTGNHRLGVFAMKPAPIQATWLGYLNTTGLTTMDYRITDDVLDPHGEPVRDTEELLRLPSGMCCFARPVDASDIALLPALRRGYLTFGSLTSLFKLNGRVFDMWSDVLKSMPSSKLLMFRDTLTNTAQENICKQFEVRGVGPDRLDLRQGACNAGYLSIYGEIDVTLDVFPCTGGVTTCESLWMGVPVLTLCGVRPVARNTAAHLTHVGLKDWITYSPKEFVARAVRLENEKEELAALRGGLRDRMITNLCDAERHTRELEEVYRMIWRKKSGQG
jgi:predicted O-linked N-acetylglucosamine transferase (SPINDLY family)